MNILTFDIEDWYNCDFISNDFDWDKYEVRIYRGVDIILEELDKRGIKGTFFCLGWIADKHPNVLHAIDKDGHHIGCHSYQHELSFRFNKNKFKSDTLKAKEKIEDVIGKEVNAFRSPGFSITKRNLWAFDILYDIGFIYDCSVLPAHHDYGGMSSYGESIPKRIDLGEGRILKEFPINIHSFLGKNIVFSGGGYFRLFPYWLIDQWGKKAEYMMTYFHPRDFDYDQPVIKSLPMIRKFKSYVGIKGAFKKFQNLLNNFEFVNLEQANALIRWEQTELLELNDL